MSDTVDSSSDGQVEGPSDDTARVTTGGVVEAPEITGGGGRWSPKRIAFAVVIAAVAIFLIVKAAEDVRQFVIVTLNGVTLAGALLRGRQRLHADLRPHARGQHGARLAVSAGRLPGAGDAGALVPGGHGARHLAERRLRRRVRLRRLVRPADPRDGDHRRHRRAHPAGLPALEPGPGPAPGADHDRAVGDHRRPDAGRLRRHLQGHPGADRVADQRAAAGRRALRLLPRRDRARLRAAGRADAVAGDQADALRQDRARRRRRPRHGLGARHQRAARLRRRVLHRRRPGRLRRRARRHDDLAGARAGHGVPAQLADRGDHRRHGLARRRRDRRACCSASSTPTPTST